MLANSAKCFLGGTGRDSGERSANEPEGLNLVWGNQESRTEPGAARGWSAAPREERGGKGLAPSSVQACYGQHHDGWVARGFQTGEWFVLGTFTNSCATEGKLETT